MRDSLQYVVQLQRWWQHVAMASPVTVSPARPLPSVPPAHRMAKSAAQPQRCLLTIT
jgi:hypothetical protein